MSVVRDLEDKFPVRFSLRSLGAKDGSIYCDICRQIKSADIGLFDLSTYNPNVILELGLAIGIGTYVFVLRSRRYQQRQRTLSDLNGILEYRFSRRSGWLTFQANFRRSLRSKLRLVAKKRMQVSQE
jgi:nucleoside 2-deoxyribosyltransferase